MTLNNEKKQEILLQSFNVLKKNIQYNSDSLKDLILKMSAMDVNTALEMWKYILENYQEIGEESNETYFLTAFLKNSLGAKIGYSKVIKFIMEDQVVRNKLYYESAQVDENLPAYFIDGNLLDKANEIFELVYSNKNIRRGSYPFGTYLLRVLEFHCKNITEDKMDFILSWVDKVPTEEARAKLHVFLLEYM